jgi:hypothetical protein
VGGSDCNFDFDEVLDLVNESNDSEAVELMGNAISSVQKGNIVEGRAEAKVAEMRAKLVLAGDPPELKEAYGDVKLALANDEYGRVDELAVAVQKMLDDRGKSLFDLNNPLIQLILLLSSVAIVAILALLVAGKFKTKNS